MAATETAAAPRYAPPDPTLPKPWKGLVDGKTGYIYFWNPETNATQYERPTGSDSLPKSSAVSLSSSVHVQRYSEGHCEQSPGRESDRYNRCSNGSLKMEAETMSNQTARSASIYLINGPSAIARAGIGGSGGHGSSSEGLSTDAYRRKHEITMMGDDLPLPLMSFQSSGFPSEILREVQNAGFSAPTPIQAQSWPIALRSRDIVAIAKTGSGKTLGYLIPGFMHIKRCRNNPLVGPTVLVLSPTRELATQIQDEAVKFGRSSRISCTCLYGGAQKGPQLRELQRGADIVVATPGRLNDILEMRRVSLHQVSYLVLDEADRMLDMGFEPQIRRIVKQIPARRQTLMFTATWPKEVRKIAADLLVNPVQVNIGNVDELVANKSITQYVEVLGPMDKSRRLEQILRSQESGSKVIIFCSTKKMCDQLSRNLSRQFGAAAIHGDKSQNERDYVLNQFRSGKTPILVATDVAARGLDIKDIRVVINYDFPTGVEDYVHRIGRTGRAGATGIAYTFFGDQDAKYASDLVKVLEGANQRVPPEVRDMASRGGGMGRPRRWGSGPSVYEGGRGGRNDSGFNGRDGGRGGRGTSTFSFGRQDRPGGRGYGHESRDRYDRGYGDGHDRSKTWSHDRSPSPHTERRERVRERSPPRGFHDAMVKRGQHSPPSQARKDFKEYRNVGSHNPLTERSRSPYGAAANTNGKGRSYMANGGNAVAPGTFAGDEEEGMIPPDDDDTHR